MSSASVGTRRRSRPRLRHPAEVPFFIFMVLLNLLIIAVILNAAAVLPFLPDRLQDTGWATAIRAALIGLLLLVPGLIVVREIQRASTRGTAVQLSQRQFPDQSGPPRTSPTSWGCGGHRRSSWPTATGP